MHVKQNPELDQSKIRPRLSFMGIMNGVKMYDSTPEYMGEELEKRATKVAEFFLWYADRAEEIISANASKADSKLYGRSEA